VSVDSMVFLLFRWNDAGALPDGHPHSVFF
jgi:hypothetical protein